MASLNFFALPLEIRKLPFSTAMTSLNFFALPPEIRIRILRHAFVEADPITADPPSCTADLSPISRPFDLTDHHPTARGNILTFARASRQAHAETTAVYYGDNVFELSSAAALHRFLVTIGPRSRGLLQRLAFCYRGRQRREAFELLRGCRGLRRLRITISAETCVLAGPGRGLLAAEGMAVLRTLRARAALTVELRELGDVVFESGPGGAAAEGRLVRRTSVPGPELRELEGLLAREMSGRGEGDGIADA